MSEYRGWVALKPLKIGDRRIVPGTPVPEAEGFPLRDQMFYTHQLGWEGEGPVPMRHSPPPNRAEMAVHDRMLRMYRRKGVAA